MFLNYELHFSFLNHNSGVIVSMLASSVVDHGYETQSCQTKDYEISIWCFSYKQAENWISNGNTDINKLWKICCTDSLALKKTTYYHKNEWIQINMSSIIAGSMLGVQFPHMAKGIQYNTMWYSLRDFQQVSGFPRHNSCTGKLDRNFEVFFNKNW